MMQARQHPPVPVHGAAFIAADHAGMAAEAYPARELEWLITAAWNKGCNHQFFGRTQEAVELMCAAEALVEDCPALIAKQQVVADA